MARMPDLEEFAAEHKLKIVTVESIINYRIQKELLVRRTVENSASDCTRRTVQGYRL